jgi:hypothetical protein
MTKSLLVNYYVFLRPLSVLTMSLLGVFYFKDCCLSWQCDNVSVIIFISVTTIRHDHVSVNYLFL